MKLATLLSIISIIFIGIVIKAQELPGQNTLPETQSRESIFHKSRPDSSANSQNKPPKNPNKQQVGKTVKHSPLSNDNSSRYSSTKNDSGGASPVGAGYSVLRLTHGQIVKVDPNTVFHSGDQVRIMIEPSVDGYLYVFDTEDDKEPEMIYPNISLDQGNNRIEAHVSYHIPYPYWFRFSGDKPLTERVYIIISRHQLPNIPIGKELITYCRNKDTNDCTWSPSNDLWVLLKGSINNQNYVVINREYGQPLSKEEEATRKLKLDKNAPKPSVLYMDNSNKEILVFTIDLKYR